MAKRAMRAMKGAGSRRDEVTYFYLIKHTDRGSVQRAAAKEKGQSDVNKAVTAAGGRCALYLTRGGCYDYVSVMTGLSPASAIQIVAEIESRGTVKATLISGVHLMGSVSI
jgi:uncharacterized protein with GYD domain